MFYIITKYKENSPMVVRSNLGVLLLLNKLMVIKRDVTDVTDVGDVTDVTDVTDLT